MHDSAEWDWLNQSDLARRLYWGRRRIQQAVELVYHGAYRLDWARARDEERFLGCVNWSDPVTIQISPKPIREYRRGRNAELIHKTVIGVSLHEASHLENTPPSWGQIVSETQAAYHTRLGYSLPTMLVYRVLNYVEDVWVEGKLPGFTEYFVATDRYDMPDRTCKRCAAEAKRLNQQWRKETTGHTQEQAINVVNALLRLFHGLVKRPGIVSERSVPGELVPLRLAAQEVQAAGQQVRVTRRIEWGMEITANLFAFLREYLPQPMTADEAATALDLWLRGLEKQQRKEFLCPIEGDPTEKRRARAFISSSVAAEIEAIARQEEGAEETLDAETLDVQHEAVSAACGSYPTPTIRIVDSWRESLCNVEEIEAATGKRLEHLIEYIRHKYAAFEHPLQGLLIRYGEQRQISYSSRSGDDIAGTELPEIVFVRSRRIPASQLDLTVLLDESASMALNARWELASLAVILLEQGLKRHFTTGLRLRVYGYTSDWLQEGTVLLRHYDSGVPRLKRPNALAWCYPKGSTPTGEALAAIGREIRATQRPNSLPCLLLVTDGAPDSATRATAEWANLERDRMRPFCLQIGKAIPDSTMAQIFGAEDKWLRVGNASDIPAAIIQFVLAQLH